jgi:hypothetical protein
MSNIHKNELIRGEPMRSRSLPIRTYVESTVGDVLLWYAYLDYRARCPTAPVSCCARAVAKCVSEASGAASCWSAA